MFNITVAVDIEITQADIDSGAALVNAAWRSLRKLCDKSPLIKSIPKGIQAKLDGNRTVESVPNDALLAFILDESFGDARPCTLRVDFKPIEGGSWIRTSWLRSSR